MRLRLAIARHNRRRPLEAIHLKLHVVSACGAVLLEFVDDGTHQRAGIDRRHSVWRSARLHATEVEQTFDQPVQPLGLSSRCAVVRLASLLSDHATIEEHLRQLAKRGERRPELVRDRRYEI